MPEITYKPVHCDNCGSEEFKVYDDELYGVTKIECATCSNIIFDKSEDNGNR